MNLQIFHYITVAHINGTFVQDYRCLGFGRGPLDIIFVTGLSILVGPQRYELFISIYVIPFLTGAKLSFFFGGMEGAGRIQTLTIGK